MTNIIKAGLLAGIAGLGFLLTNFGSAAETGIIAKSSNYSARETIQRFESAVKAKAANGWIVFTEIDHAAAAQKAGLDLKPRTVVVFGNPKLGTTPMQKAATLAIDVPLKALVWEDEQGKVWLSYNAGQYLMDYVYPRHGLTMPAEMAKGIDQVLNEFSDQATK
jgi:uncharacterized protein (DUF302 family)